MKQCLVMQHVAFEDMGTFAPVLEEKGFAIRYCPVDEPPTEEEWLAADLAVVLGGAIGVYDQVLYPFLKDEKDLIRKRLESQKPLLGICLGAQLIASVLKSRVYPGKGKEIGWGGVELTEAGKAVASWRGSSMFCRMLAGRMLGVWKTMPTRRRRSESAASPVRPA